MGKQYGYIVIPGIMTSGLFVRVPEVPEGHEYPVIKGWDHHEELQSTLGMIQVINRQFLNQFNRLPQVVYGNIQLQGSTYATPMIRFSVSL